MGLFRRKQFQVIHVEFFDVETGNLFAAADMPVERLPESFEAATTMHLGTDDWEVVEARPMTSAEFRASGKLVLILRRVKKILVDPKEVLFSLPTIADVLPPISEGSSKLAKSVLEIHEDDWRQVEFVSGSLVEAIESELSAIEEIYREQRTPVGAFRKLHVRKQIMRPLEGVSLTVEELLTAIGPRAEHLEGISYHGAAGIVRDSFATRLFSSIELFGTAPAGHVDALCVGHTVSNNVPQPDLKNLAELAAAHGLVLVDWRRARVVNADLQAFLDFFVNDS